MEPRITRISRIQTGVNTTPKTQHAKHLCLPIYIIRYTIANIFNEPRFRKSKYHLKTRGLKTKKSTFAKLVAEGSKNLSL
jgi:sulfur relay (sulfurtransferase) DsrF/TusC family protein